MRAAPPAVDPVVSGKVLFVGDDGLAEIGERKSAALVRPVPITKVVFPKGAQLFVETADRRSQTESSPSSK
jgi:hypothetical protein